MMSMKAVVVYQAGGPDVLARRQGAIVAATTRKPERQPSLHEYGAQHVFIDEGGDR